MTFDAYTVLARALEREEALLWNLKELLISLDQSSLGPASHILPGWQLRRIEEVIESSEEEVGMLNKTLEDLEEEDFN